MMTARVQRVQCKAARVALRHCPWAKRVVRVGPVYVCYERPEDADDEHGKVTMRQQARKGAA